jgi:hypothetical protein
LVVLFISLFRFCWRFAKTLGAGLGLRPGQVRSSLNMIKINNYVLNLFCLTNAQSSKKIVFHVINHVQPIKIENLPKV